MIIATGSASTEDQAKNWLVAHGAHITSGGVVDLIELPNDGRLEVLRSAHDWQYCIVAYDAVGNDEPQYVEVEHDIDATETILRLKGEPSESVSESEQSLPTSDVSP